MQVKDGRSVYLLSDVQHERDCAQEWRGHGCAAGLASCAGTSKLCFAPRGQPLHQETLGLTVVTVCVDMNLDTRDLLGVRGEGLCCSVHVGLGSGCAVPGSSYSTEGGSDLGSCFT